MEEYGNHTTHSCSAQRSQAARATNTQQTWRQEFLGSRSSTVEQSSTRTEAAGTFLRFFQTIFENTSLWRLKRLVTLSTYRRYINECIYLSNNVPLLCGPLPAKPLCSRLRYAVCHTVCLKLAMCLIKVRRENFSVFRHPMG